MKLTVAIFAIFHVLLTSLAANAAGLDRFSRWDDSISRTVDHSAWGAFLSEYLDTAHPDGIYRVRYGAVSDEDKRLLAGYIRSLARIDPAKLGKNEAFAWWVNLYNALTVKLILDRYPVKSILDIKPSLFAFGPWKMKLVTVEGDELSLDNIEHDILRTHWKEPRVHYVINCASIGCPNLPERPLTGETLDATLDKAARDYINHERGVRFDAKGRLVASSIYKWFSGDFGGTDAQIVAHLRRYARPPLNDKLRNVRTIARYEYDWTLNDVKRR